MKVLFLNYCSQSFGGAETYWYETAKGLTDAGVEVLKLCLKNDYKKIPNQIINEFKPDIIHINKSDLLAKKIKETYETPVVVTVHDYYTVPFSISLKNNLKKFINEHKCHADKYIIPASHYFYLLNKKKIPDIHFIPHFVDTEKWLFDFNEIEIENKILYVGRLEKLKGIHVLLNAVRILLNKNIQIQLEIIGDGSERENIRRKIVAWDLDRHINLTGSKKQTEILNYFHTSTLLVIPTLKNELFGLVGLEAQASGLPVIASDLPGVREWCLHGKTGMTIKPNSPQALASMIDLLLNNKDLRENLRYNARKYAEVTFTKEKSIRELLFLYQRLIRHAQPTAINKIPAAERSSV